MGRERQKEQYDKGNKLTTFQPGEMVYLREMIKGKRGCPKSRLRWKGPYEVLRGLSDLNYVIRIARNKEIMVKRYYRRVACRHPRALISRLQLSEDMEGRI